MAIICLHGEARSWKSSHSQAGAGRAGIHLVGAVAGLTVDAPQAADEGDFHAPG